MAASTTGHVAIEATPESVGMSSVRLDHITRLVQRYVDEGKYAGAISLVARRDRVVHFETYGKLNAEAGTPMQPDAIFRLASMTKPIVSVALMSLYEEGHFQLDTPVAEFIPAFKDVQVFAGGTADSYTTRPPVRAITVADLLRHTAGFEALTPTSPVGELYRRAGVAGLPATGTLAERAAALARIPLVGDPGAQFTYHYATDVVGHLCELIAGQPLDVFLGARVLEPLGMRDAAFHVLAPKRDRLAGWYDQANDGDARYRPHDPTDGARYDEGATYFSAGGGLTSTTADYLRFTRMLARGGELDGERIIGARTLRFMASNHLPGGCDLHEMWAGGAPPSTQIARGTGFGLGFAVLLDPARAAVLGTPGEYYWGGAYSTAFFVAPAEEMIMIFMTQLGGSNYMIRRQLRVAAYQAIID